MEAFLDKPLWMWGGFLGLVLALLIFDLFFLNRKDHEISVKESIRLSLFYVSLAILFGGWIWVDLGPESAYQYYTAWLLEQTLSLDNIFVMSLVFGYFNIPRRYQHRVLFWGILGVILMRGIFIGSGTWIVNQFQWVLYFFGAFLVFTGIKMLMMADEEPDIANNKILKLAKKYLPVYPDLQGNKFFVRMPDLNGGDKLKLYCTPLFITLVVIEFVDVIFAIDSVPAVLAVTTDPFIVYTSNIFAILGLRSLYFALAAMLHRFEYLEYALSIVLIFIGAKIFMHLIPGMPEIPPFVALAVTVSLLAGGIIYSLIKTKKDVEPPAA